VPVGPGQLRRRLGRCLAVVGLLTASLTGLAAQVSEEAAAIHARVLTLDSHLDTPAHLARPDWDIMRRQDYALDRSQVDYPRMVEGGLDGGFWVIYTPQGPVTPEANDAAFDRALGILINIREMVARNPEQFELAWRAEDAERIVAAGRRVVYMSIENGAPIGADPRRLETFYNLGVRMFGPVHFRNNHLADSSTDLDGPRWGGLSPLGKALVAEANRLGMILDASHASDPVLDQMLELSVAPIVLSHSSSKGVYAHPRNVDDERMRRIAAAGGVLQMNAFGSYLVPVPPSEVRRDAFNQLAAEYGNFYELEGERLAAYMRDRAALEANFPVPVATLDDLMAHLLHALDIMGVDHVGIGADWDGGGGVEGMWDVTGIPLITARLLEAGYSEADIGKIWSGNLLRVMSEVEAVSARLRAAGTEAAGSP